MRPFNLTIARLENHDTSASSLTPAEVSPGQQTILHRITQKPNRPVTVYKSVDRLCCQMFLKKAINVKNIMHYTLIYYYTAYCE